MSRLYLDAARVLEAALARKATVKAGVYGLKGAAPAKKRQLLFLCSQTLAHAPRLTKAFQDAGATEAFADVRRPLLLVMAFEFLMGRGIQGGGSVKRRLKEWETRLRAVLPAEAAGAADARKGRFTAERPRYVRVNTLLANPEAMRSALAAPELLGAAASVRADPHVRHLLAIRPVDEAAFPASLRLLATHDLVQSGRLVLQDKASCLPAHVLLQGGWGWGGQGDMIDACAAPGNKTTHVAALLASWWEAMPAAQRKAYGRRPKAFAFDKDPTRAKLLEDRVATLGADKWIAPEAADFLAQDAADRKLAGVRGILLDPSCSGSGMVQHDDAPEATARRLRGLRAFQTRALKHALGFPQVVRVVYSTCSVHQEENEAVVAEALDGQREAWELREVLPAWKRRGEAVAEGPEILSDAERQALLRARPEDGTHGFFVACFERRGMAEPDFEEPGPVKSKKRGRGDEPGEGEEDPAADAAGDAGSKPSDAADELDSSRTPGVLGQTSEAQAPTASALVRRGGRSSEARKARKRRKRKGGTVAEAKTEPTLEQQ